MFIDVGTNSVTGKHYIVNTNYIESMVVHEDGLTLVMSSGDKGHLDAKQSEVLRQTINDLQHPQITDYRYTTDPTIDPARLQELLEEKFG